MDRKADLHEPPGEPVEAAASLSRHEPASHRPIIMVTVDAQLTTQSLGLATPLGTWLGPVGL
jgi:hypothetical protein